MPRFRYTPKAEDYWLVVKRAKRDDYQAGALGDRQFYRDVALQARGLENFLKGRTIDGFICGDKEFLLPCACGYVSDFLCDYPMGKGKTCDAPLCEYCAIELKAAVPLSDAARFKSRKAKLEDMHLCPAHFAIVQTQK